MVLEIKLRSLSFLGKYTITWAIPHSGLFLLVCFSDRFSSLDQPQTVILLPLPPEWLGLQAFITLSFSLSHPFHVSWLMW
jgi:hypothetical protein